MRQALLDHLREQNRNKRGVGWQRLPLSGLLDSADGDDDEFDLEALDCALSELSALDDRAAQIIQLRFFGGLSETAVAEVLGISERTVRADWSMARAWLRTRLDGNRG